MVTSTFALSASKLACLNTASSTENESVHTTGLGVSYRTEGSS